MGPISADKGFWPPVPSNTENLTMSEGFQAGWLLMSSRLRIINQIKSIVILTIIGFSIRVPMTVPMKVPCLPRHPCENSEMWFLYKTEGCTATLHHLILQYLQSSESYIVNYSFLKFSLSNSRQVSLLPNINSSSIKWLQSSQFSARLVRKAALLLTMLSKQEFTKFELLLAILTARKAKP